MANIDIKCGWMPCPYVPTTFMKSWSECFRISRISKVIVNYGESYTIRTLEMEAVMLKNMFILLYHRKKIQKVYRFIAMKIIVICYS